MILEGNTLNSKLLLTLRVFDSRPYRYRGYIKSIIENIRISGPNDEAKEDWSVGRLASFHPRFSSGSTVLARMQKKHYMAINF